MNVVDEIRSRLAVLEPQSLWVEDESAQHAGHEGARGGGGHYRVRIVSSRFGGEALQARHRMVYSALGALMQKEIHMLAIDARAPNEIAVNDTKEKA